MDVRRNDPEVVTLVDNAIQLASVANPATVLVVQENRGTVVGTDLMEGMPGEVLITHYLIIAKLVERLLYSIEIPLELALRCAPTALQEFLAFVRVYARCNWEVAPTGFPCHRRAFLIERDEVIEYGASVRIGSNQPIEHCFTSGHCVVSRQCLYQGVNDYMHRFSPSSVDARDCTLPRYVMRRHPSPALKK
jgi:hypothetical protein